MSESFSHGTPNRKHRGKFPAPSLKNVISAPRTQSQRADGLQNQSFILTEICEPYTANMVQSPNRMFFADFHLIWIKCKGNKKNEQKHHIESATLSINLAILTSLLESPPQSCVVNVTWTCADTDTQLLRCRRFVDPLLPPPKNPTFAVCYLLFPDYWQFIHRSSASAQLL